MRLTNDAGIAKPPLHVGERVIVQIAGMMRRGVVGETIQMSDERVLAMYGAACIIPQTADDF